jgi:hypothetical protein
MTGKPRLAAPLAVALIAASFAAVSANAEDNGGIGGFFSHLFGAPPSPTSTPSPKNSDSPSPRPSASHKPRKKPHEPATTREASAPAAPSTPSPEATEFVYVLGDSLAISAADGMDEDLEGKPEIGVVDRARDASGLVRDDYFDWAKAARELVGGNEPAPKDKEAKDKDAKAKDAKDKPAPAAETKPKIDYVVIMLGINDMQQLRDGKDYVDPLTDRWKAVYSQRIQAVVAPLRAAHVPVLWVGLPPMRSEKFNAQVVALNQVFKENAEKAGATFVDIFDDFADQGGQFDAFGPNIEGQKVKLRGPDGIHLTPAGGKKLAHFLDVEILKALNKQEPPSTDIAALPPDLSRTTDDVNEQIRREMGQPAALTPGPAPGPKPAPIAEAAPEPPKPVLRPEAGPIASLATRPVSPGATLASVASPAASEAARILRLGEPPRAAPGRADDFSR